MMKEPSLLPALQRCIVCLFFCTVTCCEPQIGFVQSICLSFVTSKTALVMCDKHAVMGIFSYSRWRLHIAQCGCTRLHLFLVLLDLYVLSTPRTMKVDRCSQKVYTISHCVGRFFTLVCNSRFFFFLVESVRVCKMDPRKTHCSEQVVYSMV